MTLKAKRSSLQDKRLFSISFIAPSFILYVIFIIIPIGASFYIAMTKWDGVSAPKFRGLYNFKYLMQDPQYWITVSNTLQVVFFSLLLQIPLGLLFAYIIMRTVKGYKFFRSVYFLPVVIAPAAISLMFLLMLNGELGPINKFFVMIGLPSLQRNWLSDGKLVLYSVMFPMIWQYIGFYIIIFLAAFQSVPADISESATIDGASSLYIFIKIYVPLIWDVVKTCMILCITGSLKAFDHAYIMTWGGPGVRSSYLAVYMYRTAFTENLLGEGTAIAITILIFAFALTYLFNKFLSREVIQY